jgi:hypothetical protein
MDRLTAESISALLGEVGITVSTTELLEEEEEAGAQPPPAPPHPQEACDDDDYLFYEPADLPSFVHLSHLQRITPSAPYKRTTHFAAHLDQLLGRNGLLEDTALIARLKRSGVDMTDRNAYFTIRTTLKLWGYTSPHYRRIFSFIKALGGKVMTLSYSQEVEIRRLFEILSSRFSRRARAALCGKGTVRDETGEMRPRKNFPSYYLILQVLLSRVGARSHYLLPSIKDTSKFGHLITLYQSLCESE